MGRIDMVEALLAKDGGGLVAAVQVPAAEPPPPLVVFRGVPYCYKGFVNGRSYYSADFNGYPAYHVPEPAPDEGDDGAATPVVRLVLHDSAGRRFVVEESPGLPIPAGQRPPLFLNVGVGEASYLFRSRSGGTAFYVAPHPGCDPTQRLAVPPDKARLSNDP